VTEDGIMENAITASVEERNTVENIYQEIMYCSVNCDNVKFFVPFLHFAMF
jgi:hypothetical protein